jgi:hypothetical protein
MGIAVSATYARFDEQHAKDRDVGVGEVTYIRTLYAEKRDSRSDTEQKEIIGISFVPRAAYNPGFSGRGVRTYASTLSWELSNVPLGSDLCGKPKAWVNCFTAGLLANVSRNWVGNEGSLKNYGFQVGSSLNWNIRGRELILGVSGSVTDSLYDDFPGSRNDVYFAYGPLLTWSPSDTNLALSAAMTFYSNLSNVDAAEFDKGLFTPQILATWKF